MAFQDPSFMFGGYCLNSVDPILLTPSLTNISIQFLPKTDVSWKC